MSCAGDALGHLARVHEDERRAVLAHQLGDARVDLLPLLVRADGRERRGRDLDREVELAEGARVDERALAARRRPGSGRPRRAASASPRGRCAGAAGRSAPRAARARARGASRACRATSAWISSTITVRTVGSIAAAAVARQQEVERLRRRDQDVRRPLASSPRARRAACRRCARARGPRAASGPARGSRASGPCRFFCTSFDERAQRRDVEDLRLVGQRGALPQRARRSPTGTRRASCPSPSARRSACAGPSRMRGQPSRWGAVGSPRRSANQRPTAGWKEEEGSTVFPMSVHPKSSYLHPRKRFRARNGHAWLRANEKRRPKTVARTLGDRDRGLN